MITILFLTCIIYAPNEGASWSIGGAPHTKRHSPPTYNWEQSWKSQTNNQITTITTSTSGTIPPNSGFDQGGTSTWSYQYSYSSSNDGKDGTGFSGRGGQTGHSNNSPATTPIQQGQASSPPKPIVESPSKPKQNLPTIQPKYANTKSPGLTGSSDTKTLSRGDWPPVSNSRYSSAKSNSSPFSDITNQESPDNNAAFSNSKTAEKEPGGREKPIPSSAGPHQDWLDSHNNYRSQYGVRSLTWSEDLVEAARSQVEKCVWKHTKHNQYGENIAAGQNTASEVVIAWVEGPNEREVWNPSSNTPTHFTQVVWKDTEQIGCAFKSCETIEGSNLPQSPVKLWACEYHPKGNIGGQYKQNVLAAAGGKPLASAGSAAFASVDPDDPSRAKAGGSALSRTVFSPAPE